LSRRTFSILDIDWITVGLYLMLAITGWLMVYAAGYDPQDPTGPFDFATRGGKQLLFIFFSGAIGLAILLIEPQFFKTISYLIYGFIILLLIGVMTYGAATNGAMSWFQLPGGFKLQPSEFAKFATCIALATYLSGANISMKKTPNIIMAISMFLFPAMLIVIQGDPGSALVFFALMIPLFREGLHPILYILGLLLIVLFVCSLIYNPIAVIIMLLLVASLVSIMNFKEQNYWILAYIAVLGTSLWFYQTIPLYVAGGVSLFLLSTFIMNFVKGKKEVATFLFLGVIVMSSFSFSVNYLFNEILEPHQQDRINVWLMPEKADKRGSYYNLRQSKLAIGSGRLWGKGHKQGEMTQGDHVPEQHTDFIFTVVGEEQGFIGALFVILLYMGLLLRLTFIAERQRSKFTRIYAYGVAGIISFHLLVNIGMTMGLMPVIGIPLPLMSYGGSSLLSFTIMIAVLLRFDSQRLLVFR
jgi:rod shape determining protein RodA